MVPEFVENADLERNGKVKDGGYLYVEQTSSCDGESGDGGNTPLLPGKNYFDVDLTSNRRLSVGNGYLSVMGEHLDQKGGATSEPEPFRGFENEL